MSGSLDNCIVRKSLPMGLVGHNVHGVCWSTGVSWCYCNIYSDLGFQFRLELMLDLICSRPSLCCVQRCIQRGQVRGVTQKFMFVYCSLLHNIFDH